MSTREKAEKMNGLEIRKAISTFYKEIAEVPEVCLITNEKIEWFHAENLIFDATYKWFPTTKEETNKLIDAIHTMTKGVKMEKASEKFKELYNDVILVLSTIYD